MAFSRPNRRRPGPSPLPLSTFCLLVAASLSADSPAPHTSYTKPTPDGRHLFVMIGPDSVASETTIGETYSLSGLYPNDGSTEPIWTVGWYAHDVEVLSDGIHLVRLGPWASSSSTEAVSFFARGTRIRSYTVGDLVTFPSFMPHSVSHFFWRADSELDDEARQYLVTTNHGARYTFDVTTGSIVTLPNWWLLAAGVGIAAGALTFRSWRRRPRR